MTQQRRASFRSLRGIGMGLVAVALAAFAGGAATAAISQDAARAPAWDQNVQWRSVAHGRDANFGRYEIFRMPDGVAPHGQTCIGISLPDHDLPGVARAIAAGCYTSAGFGVAFMRGTAGTLAYGVTDGQTRSVTLDAPGREPNGGGVVTGPGNEKYFVVSSAEHLSQPHVRAVDDDGNTTAEQSISD